MRKKEKKGRWSDGTLEKILYWESERNRGRKRATTEEQWKKNKIKKRKRESDRAIEK